MALEINEIGIRMRVGEERPAALRTEPGFDETSETEINYERIVEECVRRILQALKVMKER